MQVYRFPIRTPGDTDIGLLEKYLIAYDIYFFKQKRWEKRTIRLLCSGSV